MGATLKLLPIRETVRGRWQIPLLAVGLGLLGVGLGSTILSHRTLTFEEEMGRVELLRATHHYERAGRYLIELLRDPARPEAEQAELYRLLAAMIHDAESPRASHAPANARTVVSSFQAAMRLGWMPSAEDWLRVADAHEWLGERSAAAGALRAALRTPPERADAIRRRLVELERRRGVVSAEAEAEWDAILHEASSSDENYLWALEWRVESLLDKGDLPGAQRVTAQAMDRFADVPSPPSLAYCQARTLLAGGSVDEATARLRSARDRLASLGEEWAKLTWLLGRTEQLEDRPQNALALFEQVMGAAETGDLRDAGQLGRAEALAALERYPASYEAFAATARRLDRSGRSRHVDVAAVRVSATALGGLLLRTASGTRAAADFAPPGAVDFAPEGAADQVRAVRDRETGLNFLRLAMELTDPADTGLRRALLAQIADGTEALAGALAVQESLKSPSGAEPAPAALASATDPARAGGLYAEAVRARLELEYLAGSDDVQASESLWRAADAAERAGRTEQVVELLERFVARYRGNRRELSALRRLGQGYEALRRYDQAAEVYDRAVQTHYPLPDALACLVPLARCLIRQGGEAARRGGELLTDVVEDRLPKSPLTPAAPEYREALIDLAAYCYALDEKEAPDHFERAIERYEDALAFYPDDPRTTRLRFELAESYRHSAAALRKQVVEAQTPQERLTLELRVEERLGWAEAAYRKVRTALAKEDEAALSALERTQLELSYLYLGDCLFDRGDYEGAIRAYEDAAWRYNNLPPAVWASVQIVHCRQRLGQPEEALAALRRARWLMQTIPEPAFEAVRGMPPKPYWEALVERLERLGTLAGMTTAAASR